MNCQKCGERPAQVRYTEFREGASEKLLICFECARNLGFEVEPAKEKDEEIEAALPESAGTSLGGAILVNAPLTPTFRAVPEHERCPRCGLTSMELQRASRFGCAQCYEVFGAALDGWLQKIHGATRHRGRLPGSAAEDST